MPFTILNHRFVALSSTLFNAASHGSHVSLFCRLDTPFCGSLAVLFSSLSMLLHLLQRAIPRVPSNSSLKRPGMRLLHLSYANQFFLSLQSLREAPAGWTASSSVLNENLRYILSVSICMSSKSLLSMKQSK